LIHTVKLIGAGIALLLICLWVGRMMGGADQPAIMARSALVFIPLWLVCAGINLWVGVTREGYTVKEEIPFFLVVFLIPAAMAQLVSFLYSR